MKWYTKLFCKTTLKLDRIPRYGRTYKMLRQPDGHWLPGPAIWGWHRRGYWGTYRLDRMGLLWPYIDEIMGPYELEDETDGTT